MLTFRRKISSTIVPFVTISGPTGFIEAAATFSHPTTDSTAPWEKFRVNFRRQRSRIGLYRLHSAARKKSAIFFGGNILTSDSLLTPPCRGKFPREFSSRKKKKKTHRPAGRTWSSTWGTWVPRRGTCSECTLGACSVPDTWEAAGPAFAG